MNIARKKYTDVKDRLERAIGCKIHETDLDDCLRAGLYTIGHELNARRVASDEFTDQYFDQALSLLSTDASNSTITLQNCKGFSESIAEGLYGINDDNVVRELFRKGVYLNFETTVNVVDEKVLVTLEKPVWKKATRSQDVKEGSMLAMAIPNISFNDIKGHQYAKDKLQEIVKLLKNPASMDEHDIEPPKGLLLYGEPGTGKTMLAKALANEADLPFLSCTGPDLLLPETSGQGTRLQAIYKAARHYAPSIVFIDEIDILGDRNRGGHPLAINQLLAEIDGFSGAEERVFTVAATNYPDRLDPAILRSGRIELKVHVPRLDKEARRHFLEKIKALPSAGNLDVESLLDDTSGMTGAEMEQIQRQIGMYLIKNRLTEITTEQAEDIIAVIRYGERTGIHRDEENRRRVAIHEAGHAIVAMSLKPSRIIERITITSRGNMGGFVKFDEEQRLLKTPQNILNEMAICLGGRCAQLLHDEPNGMDEGSANDLEQVTLYAYLACTKLGFDEEIGWISLPTAHNDLAFTGMQSKVNERVADWINQAKALATEVLKKNKSLHAELVEMLLKDETLLPAEFESIKIRVEM
jgi:ATP-dependent Zn protease